LQFTLPKQDAVAVLAVRLLDGDGHTVMRNFVTFDVRSGAGNGVYAADGIEGGVVSVPVARFAEHSFPYQWNTIQGHKTSGGPAGSYAFEVQLPEGDE